MKMKAVVYTNYGGPEVLKIKNVEKPIPKNNEILVKIHATSVTLSDCEIREFRFNTLLWIPIRLYFGLFKPRKQIIGQELSGYVEEVGSKVKNFNKGDRIFAATGIRLGTYAQYTCIPVDNYAISKIPYGISYKIAATIPTGGLNALHYLREAKIKKNDEILIIGAAGNFGSYSVQLAKYFGAKVTGVDSGLKLDMLKKIGARYVIDYTKEDFSTNNKKYDIIFDIVGKSKFSTYSNLLNKNGRLILANPKINQIIQGKFISKKKNIRLITNFADYKSEDLEYLIKLIVDKKILS